MQNTLRDETLPSKVEKFLIFNFRICKIFMGNLEKDVFGYYVRYDRFYSVSLRTKSDKKPKRNFVFRMANSMTSNYNLYNTVTILSLEHDNRI